MRLVLILFLSISAAYADVHRVSIEPSGERTLTLTTSKCDGCYVIYILSAMAEHSEYASIKVGNSALTEITRRTCKDANYAGYTYSFVVDVAKYGFKQLRVNVCDKSSGKELCTGFKNLSLGENTCDGEEMYFYGE